MNIDQRRYFRMEQWRDLLTSRLKWLKLYKIFSWPSPTIAVPPLCSQEQFSCLIFLGIRKVLQDRLGYLFFIESTSNRKWGCCWFPFHGFRLSLSKEYLPPIGFSFFIGSCFFPVADKKNPSAKEDTVSLQAGLGSWRANLHEVLCLWFSTSGSISSEAFCWLHHLNGCKIIFADHLTQFNGESCRAASINHMNPRFACSRAKFREFAKMYACLLVIWSSCSLPRTLNHNDGSLLWWVLRQRTNLVVRLIIADVDNIGRTKRWLMLVE